jgi:SAM-dependent methyltransferase
MTFGNGELFCMHRNLTDIYYINQADQYFEKTSELDSSSFLSPFISFLKTGDTVIDIGCGSGRDLLYFKNLGLKPIGFEKSPGLAHMARKHSGCPVIEGDFLAYDFSLFTVQGICFSASLVHTPHDLVRIAISNSISAVEDKGYLYISLKEGRGSVVDSDMRRFFFWESHDIQTLFNDLGLTVISHDRTPSVRGSGDIWLSYTLSVDKNDLIPAV